MNLTHVAGNTFVLEGLEYIPLYKIDETRCILLDTGLLEEREDIEATLLSHNLTPAGILCSHAHVDHSANNAYFQQKYGTVVALTAPEAGMCSHILNLKCYCLVISPEMAQAEMTQLVHTPDVIIPNEDGMFQFLDIPFQIISTPGHSSGHISPITPDKVCYVGDALLSREMCMSKLPYALAHQIAYESREKLRRTTCDFVVMAHRGICRGDELSALVDENHALIDTRAQEILSLVTTPMDMSEINKAVCAKFSLLSSRPRRSLRFERNTRFFVEYLVDAGRLQMTCQDGIVLYHK